MAVVIYHNPRCSKSRQTLELLKDNGVEPEVKEYLKTPPTATTLRALFKALDVPVRDAMRRKEQAYKELNLDAPEVKEADLIAAIVENPILLERPIVVHGAKAAIGRPPEAVLEIL
ncbi:MAG: arsenate reductase (glutaredoxin) [Pseudomonadota bacterium]